MWSNFHIVPSPRWPRLFSGGREVLNLTIGLVKLRHRLFKATVIRFAFLLKQLGEEQREMPLGHDLILLTQMHGNAPVGVGLNFWVHSNDRTTTERSPHFPTEVFFRSGKRPYHSIDLM